MRLIFIWLLLALSYINVRATHFILGNVTNGAVLAKHTRIEYSGIPMKIRQKYLFYSLGNNQIIRGIKAFDLFDTESSVKVTAGGVGYSHAATEYYHAAIRFDSERGAPMAYGIGIYIDPYYK